ncbi:MAG: glutamine--fructose-6-phosphate transaminase (isomerizing) [Deferribacteres bacterium]|nr:glutamine--fructose-6-phosphate transaminase (isomerizing) [Deferribacteres bacterium]
MCGIVGYIGKRDAVEVVLDSLKRLEYRGYDSAGIAVIADGKLKVIKTKGKIRDLENALKGFDVKANVAIGHTRWATHGKPTDVNAHPHVCGGIAVVHNGIIENYVELKNELVSKGYSFESQTDTEVIACLIRDCYKGSLFDAVQEASRRLVGSFAIAAICENEPDTIVGYKKESPLVLGVGDGEYILASDIPAILPYTNRIIPLEDGDCVFITSEGFDVFNNGEKAKRDILTVSWSPVLAEKTGYKHFMQKEIFEQPRAIADTIQGIYSFEENRFYLVSSGFEEKLKEINRIVAVACGTSYHACLVAKYWLEKYAEIPVEVDIASEFRYRDAVIDEKTLAVFVSQSGETADTLAALKLSKEKGALTLAVCNVMGSSIAREAHEVIYTHAGPEIGVASTKAFTTQMAVLYSLSLYMGSIRGNLEEKDVASRFAEFIKIPRLTEEALELDEELLSLAMKYLDKKDFLYLGRYVSYPIALEGALKLKEISYIHAEGYPAGEMKHGPIALIDKEMPVVVVAPVDRVYEKVKGNIEEVKARDGIVIAFTTSGNKELEGKCDHVFYLPEVGEELSPFVYVIPLQLFAYHVAERKGLDVDQPRNLAKAVTVE